MNKHYLWVKTKCTDYYKFINKLVKLNLEILEIKYVQNNIYLKIEERNWEKLNKYLKSYKFDKVKDLGLFALPKFLKKYHVFLVSFIIGLFLIFICSRLIIQVNVIHENREIRELLLDELKEVGIKKISFKKSYAELQKIKNAILNKYPNKLDWLEFETEGMIMNVRVEERIITDTSRVDKKCNLVATKEGTVSSLLVSSGEALVRPNDVVKEGDVLISGIITHNNEEKKQVCAQGEVYAHTWYTVKVSMPFKHYEYRKTGKKKYNLIWDNDGEKIKIFKNRFSSFTSNYQTLLDFFGYRLLLETEFETKKEVFTYDENAILVQGLQKAEDNLKLNLNAKDTIIDKKVLKKVLNDSKMDIEIFIIVNELISKEEIIPTKEEGNDLSDMGNNQSNH